MRRVPSLVKYIVARLYMYIVDIYTVSLLFTLQDPLTIALKQTNADIVTL